MFQAIIVEDDPMVASINQRYLEMNDRFRVTGVFRNGEEAFQFLLEHPADLALVDYYMPMLDGAGFLRKCREAGLKLDVIMITAANSTKEIHLYGCNPRTFNRTGGKTHSFFVNQRPFAFYCILSFTNATTSAFFRIISLSASICSIVHQR